MNINSNKTVKSIYGEVLKNVDNFIYLGSEIESTDKEIKIIIAKSWVALDKLSSIWKSPLSTTLKRNLFRAVVEYVLLYGSKAWTLTKKHEKKLDGTYTRILRAILNISWKEHPTKIGHYGNISPLTSIIRIRRTRFAGHCYRSEEEIVKYVLLWTPNHGTTQIGRSRKTYIKQLCDDTGLTTEELKTAMKDRTTWKTIVESSWETIPIR